MDGEILAKTCKNRRPIRKGIQEQPTKRWIEKSRQKGSDSYSNVEEEVKNKDLPFKIDKRKSFWMNKC